MTSRPPRVVIVFDGDEHWSYWARRALHRTGRVWGGAGFALIPHDEGKVNPVLLRACEAYDPDFVVTYHPTVADVEYLEPGSLSVRDADGKLLTGSERETWIEEGGDRPYPHSKAEAARKQIIEVCSPYRSRESNCWHEDTPLLGDNDSEHFVNVLDIEGTPTGSVLSCPANWGGTLGAAVASRVGMSEAPACDRNEPSISDQARNQLMSWLLSNDADTSTHLSWHPEMADELNTQELITAHDRTASQLTKISLGYGHRRRTDLLVLGDTAEDFALAHLWRLTFGAAYWLPSPLGMNNSEVPFPIALGVARIAHDLKRVSGSLVVTSVSQPADQLAKTCDELQAADPYLDSHQSNKAPLTAIPASALDWRQPAASWLAVKDNIDKRVTVPVTVDTEGTSEMAAPLPAPVLTNQALEAITNLNWHVDIMWDKWRAVRRRGADSRILFVDRPAFMQTWTRSSHCGITYQAKRYDFVPSGTLPENRLARVALRNLSLATWISAKCAECNIRTQPSDAGRRSMLLSRMLGGREAYVTMFGGDLLPAFRAMLINSSTTDEAYPKRNGERDGVALSSTEGVLTFTGICNQVHDLTKTQVRGRVDIALRAGVLRRGMVLKCATCEQVQFQTIDKLGQRWLCARCDAGNELDQPAWKWPDDGEPTWYYDLHPVGRQLLTGNGDVPALLAAYLRSQQSDKGCVFDDVEEVEFLEAQQRQVELDLVTYYDDTLTVAECKKAGNDLTGNSEVRKKCKAAAWLRADRLMFATKASAWSASSQSIIQNSVQGFEGWGPLGPPQIVLVTGLGTGNVAEHICTKDD